MPEQERQHGPEILSWPPDDRGQSAHPYRRLVIGFLAVVLVLGGAAIGLHTDRRQDGDTPPTPGLSNAAASDDPSTVSTFTPMPQQRLLLPGASFET
ncbi:MAG: hypothetical protein ACR2I1_02320, partial [Propionibacteriaceae bacterium]